MKGFLDWRDLFPHDPRPAQEGIMDDMSDWIRNGRVGLLEGSNGIGKTLASLSAGLSSTKEQVIFATRTHSQIKHVVEEFKKINKKAKHVFRCLVLGARKKYCVNPWITSSSVPSSSVSYLCKTYIKGMKCVFDDISDQSFEYDIPAFIPKHLPKILDIESLVEFGLSENYCPYFTMKEIIDTADLVITPYNFIFSEIQRISVGLELSDRVIIVDEGHNSLDVIRQINREDISIDDIRKAFKQLSSSSIKSSTVSMLVRFRDFLKTFPDTDIKILAKNKRYVFGGTFVDYLAKKGFTKKWMRYIVTLGSTVNSAKDRKLLPTPILKVVSFFVQLLSANPNDTIVFWNRKSHNKTDKITIGLKDMDASSTIERMTDQDTNLIFMSGTLHPISRFARRLGLKKYEFNSYTNDVTKDNLRVFLLQKGLGGHPLSTVYKDRNNEEIVLDYGTTIRKAISVIPNGSLIFFPSYAVKNAFAEKWIEEGIMDEKKNSLFFINGKTEIPVFQEERGINFEQNTFPKYTRFARKDKAVLMAVVRGRSSEGIDFPHELSRGIFIVGVPFKNSLSPEVQAEMSYYDEFYQGTGSVEYTEDAMASVNQSIGRGYRDPKDYYVTYLMDARFVYRKADLYNALSQWIAKNIAIPTFDMSASKAIDMTRDFFIHR